MGSRCRTVEVALALVWRQGCLLVARRALGAHLAGFWEFPGGKLLPGESPESCAVREALEEVGVACEPLGRRPPLLYEYPDRTVRLTPVDCRYAGGPPRALRVTEWAWVVPGELERYTFPPANEPLLRALAQQTGCR